jgi:hypothetical protein
MINEQISSIDAPSSARFDARLASLQSNVNAAAQSLHERGIRPTVMRVRAALGGGSPNELGPALKHWKDTIFPTLPLPRLATGDRMPMAPLPTQVADLAREIWQRATAAAAIELQGGKGAVVRASRSGEIQGLRIQITALRDQYEREAAAYGELRIQAARNEALMREALANARDAETRELELLRELGSSRQTAAELQAQIDQLSHRLARNLALERRRRREVEPHRKRKKPQAASRRAQQTTAASQRLRKAAPARKGRQKPTQRRSRPQ